MSCTSIGGDSSICKWFEKAEPRTRCLLVTFVVLALLSAAVASTMAGCGHSLSFNEWQAIQLPLALMVLSLASATALVCIKARSESGAASKSATPSQAPQSPRGATPQGRMAPPPGDAKAAHRSARKVGPIDRSGPYKITCRGTGSRGAVSKVIRFNSQATIRDVVRHFERENIRWTSCSYQGRPHDLSLSLIQNLRLADLDSRDAIEFTY